MEIGLSCIYFYKHINNDLTICVLVYVVNLVANGEDLLRKATFLMWDGLAQ